MNSKHPIPRLGLGGGPLGGLKDGFSDVDAQEVMDAAWQSGIRYYDTAPWYGNTHSEHRLGRFLRGRTNDEHFAVTTKVGRLYRRPRLNEVFAESKWAKRWPGGLEFMPDFDYSADAIMRSYEDSLQRLGLPRVSGLAIHDLDVRHQQSWEGVEAGFRQLSSGGGYRALAELKASGEIDLIGVGINHTGMIKRFLDEFDIDYVLLAMPYTLLDQSALESDLPLCEENNITVIIGAPFASGILATGSVAGASYGYRQATEKVRARVAGIEAVCRDFSVTLPAAALQFPLAHPAVMSIVPGAESGAQVRANITAAKISIPQEFWASLRKKGLISLDAPVPSNASLSEVQRGNET